MARRGFQGVMMRSFGARDHIATVTGIEHLAPHVLRVSMHSDTLFEDAIAEPTAWLRFWFPDPEDPQAEHQRGYTIVEADETSGDFAVDVVLHSPAGPASTWAASAEPGQRIAVTTLGSTRFTLPEELPAGYLLIGDSASMPAIAQILTQVPAEVPLEVFLEEHHRDDRLIPLPEHPRAQLHWVPREGPESMAAAIRAHGRDDWSDWYAWAAPETATLKALRPLLREELGFPKSELYVQAYWVEGKAMGKRRAGAEGATAEAVSSAGAATEVPRAQAPASPLSQVSAPSRPAPEPATDSGDPGEKAAPQSASRGTWRAQAGGRLLAPMRPVFIVAGILQGLITLLQLAPFVLLTELARRLLTGAAPAQLWPVGIWALVVMGAGALLAAGLMLWLHWVDARFERDLRHRLLAKLSRLPLGWFDRGSGQVKQIVEADTLSLHYLITHAVPDAVAAVVAPLAVLVYLFAVDWRIALVLLIPVLVYLVTMYLMVYASITKIPRSQAWADTMSTEAAGYLEGQPVVRVFGGAAASTFRARLGEYIRFLDEWQRPFSGQKTLMDLATRPATALLFIVVAGTLRITAGGMDPVDLLPFLLLGTAFGSRLMGIGYGVGGVSTGLLAARRIQVTLDEHELGTLESPPPASAPAQETPAGTVELDSVGFSYRPGVPVLADISLRLEPGTLTALVGPSGSGKSTLAALIARFHDVTDGTIRIDGQDIRSLSADDLYRQVGFVFQQTQIVRGTVAENIALAVPEAPMEQVVAAARDAQIHDRIMAMPAGYETELGPNAALSGGERQRLMIARAILADTPMLVLDEATAFADPESEYLVQQALSRLTAGRTVLVIAHRLRTITQADAIVVLEEGRIAETGTHAELAAAGGLYQRLWEADGARAGGPEPAPAGTGGQVRR